MTRVAALLVSAVCAVSSLACGGGSPGPSDPGPVGELTTAVVLAPTEPTADSPFAATFGYTISPSTVLLGAYRVELRFDPARIAFVAADPDMTGVRVPNTSQAATGSIAVAGAASEGFTDGVLFKGTFRALVPGVTSADFQVILAEAVDTRLRSLLD